ncbi:hypothetical protein AB0Y21_06500 [Weissella paramesenteroides]|uniref:hypothetical protein n=1 Tax=Weissella paramesenteroides TaxID=1249 RepID=UPI003F22D11A
MTDKAYIVANEQQEREVLEKLEREGCEWLRSSKNPTDFIPSHDEYTIQLPYILLVDYDQISWCDIKLLSKFEIDFDGRKEEKMSEKYVVSQEFMNELEEWKNNRIVAGHGAVYYYVGSTDISHLPVIVEDWWKGSGIEVSETNNRLIAIIRWVNGEDVFEVEKPKKWIVRSKEVGNNNRHSYVRLVISSAELTNASVEFDYDWATYFDTREEAESWANAHQEVVQVEVDE